MVPRLGRVAAGWGEVAEESTGSVIRNALTACPCVKLYLVNGVL